MQEMRPSLVAPFQRHCDCGWELANSANGQSAGAQCILELLKTFSSQKSKLKLAGNSRLTLSISSIFANKLLAVLHFPLGESVFTLASFWHHATFSCSQCLSYRRRKGRKEKGREEGGREGRKEGGREGRKEGRKERRKSIKMKPQSLSTKQTETHLNDHQWWVGSWGTNVPKGFQYIFWDFCFL